MALPINIFVVTISVVDEKNKTSRYKLYFPAVTYTIDEVIEAAQKFVTLTVAIITGKVKKASACVGIALTGATLDSTNADVQEKGQFVFDTSIGTQTRVLLPTISESFVQVNSDLLDLTDADVQAFRDALLNGVLLDDAVTTVTFEASRGSGVPNALSQARAIFRRRARG